MSTEEQTKKYSLEAQQQELQAYCRNHNLNVYQIYIDAGISGKSVLERKGLQALLSDAKVQKFDGVCVWKISRLARNLKDLLTIEQQFFQRGIFLNSISESIDTGTPHGRLGLHMLGAMSEMERKVIVENMQMGLSKKSKLGFHVGASIYGYDLIPKAIYLKDKLNTNLTINESEASVVKIIFEWFANGYGLKHIINRLNTQGIASKKGRLFSVNVIRQILKNPVYIGKVKSKSTDGTQYVTGQHQPIVTKTIWDKVQLQFASKAVVHKTSHKVFLLSSLIKCPYCKANMSGRTYTRTQKNGVIRKYYYYVCNQFINKGNSGCKQISIQAKEIEQRVLAKAQELINSPIVEKQLYEKINGITGKSDVPVTEHRKTVKVLSDLRVKRAQLMLDFERNRLDPIQFSNKMKALKEQEALLEEDTIVEKTTAFREILSMEMVHHYINRFDEILKCAEAGKQKELLQTMIARVDVSEDKRIKNIELLIEDKAITLFAS